MTRAALLLIVIASRLWAQAAPDLRGIWQAKGTAYRNLEGDKTIVDPANGKIPYRTPARATQASNFRDRVNADPLRACFQPGVPRATLLPEPFQIFQNADRVIIVYQHVHAYRVIFTDGRPHYDDGIEFYMGDSRGRWEGNTLVVDVTNFKSETWLDGAGNYHSANLHVVERYTRTAPNTLRYETTLDDPEVYQRPWTVRLDLARHAEPTFQLLEHECERDKQGVYRHPPQFPLGITP
ncbi:MAG TPA: hypothetical protein VGN17_19075 [Bryobacteraceae bacterium]|jgi:hypothetical protein